MPPDPPPGTDTAASEIRAIAHDLSQLLWVILGRARGLERATASPADIRAARAIAEAAIDATALLRHLTPAAVTDDGGPACSDLAAELRVAWDRACDAVAARHDETVTARLDVAERAAPPAAIPGPALRRILQNLLVNALEAMGPGGTVRCRVETGEGHLTVAVADTGPGVPTDLVARLFQPGATGGKPGGTGVGLAACRDLARRWGGDLELVAARAPGAVFHLRLPVADPQSAGCAAAAAPCAKGGTVEPLRLLAVDDEAPVREMLTDVLRAEGHRVDVAADHESALAGFAPGRYDAALIDVNLPGRSGRELAAELRVRDPRLVVILVTGWGGESALRDPGAADLTACKPLDLDRLQDLLSRAAALAASRRSG